MSVVTIDNSFKEIILRQWSLNGDLENRQKQLATNLTDKGVPSSSTEPLYQLVNKVKTIEIEKHDLPGFTENKPFVLNFDSLNPPTYSYGCSCAINGDYLYFTFGLNVGRHDLNRFNLKTGEYDIVLKDFYRLIQPNFSSSNNITDCRCFSYGDYIYFVGGYGYNFDFGRSITKVNTKDFSYTVIRMPFGVSEHCVEIVGSKCYIFGGAGVSADGAYKKMWCFDLISETFERKTDMLRDRRDFRSCTNGNDIYIILGYFTNSAINDNVLKYNTISDTYEIITQDFPDGAMSKKGNYPCFYKNDNLIFFYNGNYYIYNIKNNTISDPRFLPKCNFYKNSYTFDKNKLYVFDNNSQFLLCNIDKLV